MSHPTPFLHWMQPRQHHPLHFLSCMQPQQHRPQLFVNSSSHLKRDRGSLATLSLSTRLPPPPRSLSTPKSQRISMIAFIIPIHPKHYNYIYNLLEIIDKFYITIDLWLVFSNDYDYSLFLKKDKIKKIIIPNTDTGNIVTYKKFFALETLKEDKTYDYFIVCDSEITIIPENFNQENILNRINKIFENKIIYAGELQSDDWKNIIKTSCSLLTDQDILEKVTKNYSLYFWWSDLPVYKREHLTHFFNVIKYDSINCYHFDHKIYLSYLILHDKFRIVNITPFININWSLESYNTTDIKYLKILKSLKYSFSFLTKPFYNNHIDFFKKEGTFLLYHLDR